MAVVELYLFCLSAFFKLVTEVAKGSYIITLLHKYIVAIGAVTGLIYLICYFVLICFYWHYSDHIYIYDTL